MNKKIGLLIITTIICLASPHLGEKTIPITWDQLKNFDYETNQVPPSIKTLENKTVKIAGFIVPIEMDDFIDTVNEFFLVPNPLACIHIPPPPPNQIVYVKMNQTIPLDMDFRGVEITGTFDLSQTEDGLITFEISGTAAKEANIDYEDPIMDLLDQSKGIEHL